MTERFKKFKEINLSVADEKGSEVQNQDMADIIPQIDQNMGELGGLLSGERSMTENIHYRTETLVNLIVDGMCDVVKLRKEIEEPG